MDEKERNTGEFSLEDILKEFGEGIPLDAEEDITIWDGNIPEPVEAVPEVSGDTVRLDQITKAVKQQVEESVSPETAVFTPVGGEEPEEEIPLPPQPEEPKVEPYSEKWEPEYEQPIGEYIPPQPIVFRPKSRLRELKRKLVAGPEKR